MKILPAPAQAPAQYRSFLRLYSFKATQTDLTIKTYDLSQTRIDKTTVPLKQLPHTTYEVLSQPSTLMSILLRNKLIPPENAPNHSHLQVCIDYLQELISDVDVAQESIPNRTFFKKDQRELADLQLESAQAFIKEQEYQDALKAYTQAFQYTKSWKKYQNLPHLFHLMEEEEKAYLATLCLIQYQLEDGDIQDAITTLERAFETYPDNIGLRILLFNLYHHTDQADQADQALAIAQKIADKAEGYNLPVTQLLELYRYILTQRPDTFNLYPLFANLLKDPREKAHILLKGACHALEKQYYSDAQKLFQNAKYHQPDSFLDRLVELQIPSEENLSLEKKLLHMATVFEHDEHPALMVKAYRLLTHITYNPTYYNKIIAGYHAINQPQKALKWTLQFFNLLIEKEERQMAEKVALDVLEKTKTPIPLLKILKTLYTYWNIDKLGGILEQLGEVDQEVEQLETAEKIFREAFKKFNTFEFALALAEILVQKEDKKAEGIQTYYLASYMALLKKHLKNLTQCVTSIRQIDPSLEHLKLSQKMHLSAMSQILDLSQKIPHLENKIENVPANAFGKIKWAQYFGDVGIQPPLPPNIEQILNTPCPFWPEKKVYETHLLILIPQTVDGKPFTLNRLEELIQHPLEGKASKYKTYLDEIQKEFGNSAPSASYWCLLTTDVIPDSCHKTYRIQKGVLASYNTKTNLPHEMPFLLEAATAILMEDVQGNRLFSDHYTRCQELDPYTSATMQMNVDYWLPIEKLPAVGGIDDEGLHVKKDFDFIQRNIGVMAVLRLS